MKLKIDLHVHTDNSSDAFTRLDDLGMLCRRAGIDGVAITDHNRIAERVPDGVIAIRGIEVTTKVGHVIGLGVHEPIPKGSSPEATIKMIREQGGISTLPHPYDILRAGVKPETLSITPDAIEVVNSASVLSRVTWPPAKRFAEIHGIPRVAGSDSHIPETVGRAFTVIEADSTDEQSILEGIRLGRTNPVGQPITVGMRLRKILLQARRSL